MSEILGLGLDLCEIGRMEKCMDRLSFMNRVFTEDEQAYIHSRGVMAASSMAAMWACKEAAFKALGKGVTTSMKEVEILHEDNGRPVIRLHGRALEMAGDGHMMVSLTHEAGMAAAVCVWVSGS